MRPAYSAEEQFPFKGQVDEDAVNIRSDSTVSAQTVCAVKKGTRLDVILEAYDWYKVRLPKQAPAYVKKTLVECMNSANNEGLNTDMASRTFKRCESAKILKDRVNIRLWPSESSVILGQADTNEIVNVISEAGEWYKIEPIQNSFGWIHKRFVSKAPAEEIIKLAQKAKQAQAGENVILEGTVSPYGKIFKRQATHKLITADNRIFLLKADDKKSLDALNYHKAKITGKFIGNPNQKNPTIEVKILEVVD
jgi:uncharacterized protein YgiM (DUF1202 family)